MFAYVVFDLAFQYLAKRLAGENVSEMTYFLCRVGCKTLTQSLNTCPQNITLYMNFISFSVNRFLSGCDGP